MPSANLIPGCPADRQGYLYPGAANPDGFTVSCGGLNLTATEAFVHVFDPRLQYLNLSYNALTQIPLGAFVGLSALTDLWLQFNMITALPPGLLDPLTSLNTLDVSSNSLSALPNGIFDELVVLGSVFAQENRWASLPGGLLLHNPLVVGFMVNRNNLTALPPTIFAPGAAVSTVDLSHNDLTQLPVGLFADLPKLFQLALSFNRITVIQAGVFRNLTGLMFLDLQSNTMLETIDPGAMEGCGALFSLRLDGCRLTAVPVGMLASLHQAEIVRLESNRLSILPPRAFSGLLNVGSISLQGNRLSAIASTAFQGLSLLNELMLQNNSLTALEVGTFDDMPGLGILYLNDNLLTTLPSGLFAGTAWQGQARMGLQNNLITTLPAHLLTTLASYDHLAFTSSPNPLVCRRSYGAIVCDNCTLGYIYDRALSGCHLPPFGPSQGWSTRDPTSAFGAPSHPAQLYLGEAYVAVAPDLDPKQTAFVGYSGAPERIRYAAAVTTDVNISCSAGGTVVAGNTAGGPTNIYRVRNTVFGSNMFDNFQCRGTECGPPFVYDSPAAIHVFRVAEGGAQIVFDTCLSRFTTSVGIYRLNESDPSQSPSLFYPNTTRSIRLSSTSVFGYGYIFLTAKLPHIGGCGNLSLNAKTPPVTFPPGGGLYAAVVQAGSVWDYSSSAYTMGASEGAYVLSMTCGAPSQTVPTVTSALGLQVTPETGAAYANPTVPGRYRVNLTATDAAGSGAVATIREWEVEVVPRPRFQRNAEPFGYTPQFAHKPRLALGWTYAFHPPNNSAVPSAYFDNVTGVLVYSVVVVNGGDNGTGGVRTRRLRSDDATERSPDTVTGGLRQGRSISDNDASNSASAVNPGGNSVNFVSGGASATAGPTPVSLGALENDLMVNPTSGLLLLTPHTLGRYTVRVVASDGTARVPVTQPWEFEVLPPTGSWNDVNGPNGRGCGQGVEVVSPEQTGSFSCDCTDTGMTGPNCKSPRPINATAVTVAALLGALALLAGLGYGGMRLRRHLLLRIPVDFATEAAKHLTHAELLALSQNHSRGLETPTEIPRADITLVKVIGTGHFGTVQQAMYRTRDGSGRPIEFEAAVKTLTDPSAPEARSDFLREAVVTHQFDHRNVCRMLGVCTVGQPYLIVLELCSKGSLKTCLEGLGDAAELPVLLRYLKGVADGMAYLASCMFVHRDLAARNVLVSAADVVKVADFGLSRNVDGKEYYRAGGDSGEMALPLRWTDPEILEGATDSGVIRFSEATDVWAFGVTAIEVFTAAAMPYLGWMDFHVIAQLRGGYRLPCPGRCPPALYSEVIAPCWAPVATRPRFSDLVVRIDGLTLESSVQHGAMAAESGSGGVGGYTKLRMLSSRPSLDDDRSGESAATDQVSAWASSVGNAEGPYTQLWLGAQNKPLDASDRRGYTQLHAGDSACVEERDNYTQLRKGGTAATAVAGEYTLLRTELGPAHEPSKLELRGHDEVDVHPAGVVGGYTAVRSPLAAVKPDTPQPNEGYTVLNSAKSRMGAHYTNLHTSTLGSSGAHASVADPNERPRLWAAGMYEDGESDGSEGDVPLLETAL